MSFFEKVQFLCHQPPHLAIFPSQACQNKSACKAASPSIDFMRDESTRIGGTLGRKNWKIFDFFIFFDLNFLLLLIFFFPEAFQTSAEQPSKQIKLKLKKLEFSKKNIIFWAKCATYSRTFVPHKVYRRRRRFACAFVLARSRNTNCQMGGLMV